MFITKPKIFISSTIKDLPSERKAAFTAVEKVGGLPIMSEFTMEAENKDSVTACLDKVKSSDIYVLIIGGKYGWQPEGKESITELEYKTARSNGLSVIAFNTTYPKEAEQKKFEKTVESTLFRKTVSDAFELESELIKSLQTVISAKQTEYFNKTEPVYSNLVKVIFPAVIYRAEVQVDKKEIKKQLQEKGYKKLYKPSLFDYVVAALRIKEIQFPGDWVLDGKYIITFHNLQDDLLRLTEIIDRGTAEKYSCEEYYGESIDTLNTFKYLLKRCLQSKLHKKKIKWIKNERLFAFIPIDKDDREQWKSRRIQWQKINKATRTVVDIKPDLKNKEKVFNLKCLAFRSDFYLLDNIWYLSIKPEWIYLWSNLTPCDLAYKNIQWLKRNERNIHVFNNFNFILRYIQPSSTTEFLFTEYEDYKFLKIGDIETFEFAPIIPDELWRGLESLGSKNNLSDKGGNVELFAT